MNTVAKELGIGFAGMGFDPKWPVEARPHMPKVLPALHYYFDKPSTSVLMKLYTLDSCFSVSLLVQKL